MTDWSTLNSVGWEALREARLQSHHAIQWLAKVGRNFVEKQPDDSHTALTWDKELKALMVAPITGLTGTFRIGMRLHDLALLIETDHAVAPVPLLGHTDRQLEAWVSASLMEQFVDRDLAINFPRLPYEVPEHPVTDGAKYGDGLADGALQSLANWFDESAALLQAVHSEEMNASPVRCWPHHFDIATLISLDGDKSIGVGLSPGDETYPDPYFYVTPFPYPDAGSLSALTEGHWHKEGYTAAILTGQNMVTGAGPHSFVDEALNACKTVLA